MSRPPLATKLATLDELEVTVEKLIAGGDGLARHEGFPLFVPRSAPGDRLRVRLTERRADYGRAEIVEILTPGAGRRDPPCPYFERCGGCDLQHLEDDLQPRLKMAAVRETLERLAGLDWEKEVGARAELVTGEAWAYRLRTQLHTEVEGGPEEPDGAGQEDNEAGEGEPTVPPAATAPGRVEVGYHERGSRRLVAVDRCPILVPELEALLPRLPRLLTERLGEARPPRRLDLTAGDSGEVTVAPRLEGLPTGEVTLTAAGSDYTFDARSFFQAHRGLLARLVELVIGPDPAAGGGAESGEALDLYAGVGLFTLPLARRYGRVTAVEGDAVAARFCRNNARRNRLGNVEVVTQAVDTWARRLPIDAARVVVDPPRSGLSRPLLRVLLDRPPRHLTYVSCHPATLARDLKGLKWLYAIEHLAVVDLFPQTGHVESVVQLRRKK